MRVVVFTAVSILYLTDCAFGLLREQCEYTGSVVDCENATLFHPFAEEREVVNRLLISFCNISDLNSDDFRWLPYLSSLRIINSNLGSVSDGAFATLKKLVLLEIRNSDFEDLNPLVFAKETSVVSVVLSSNRIKTIPENFSFPQSVHNVQLNENKLGKIREGMFVSNYKLMLLDLSFNEIEKVFPRTFNLSGDVSDSVLRLNNNKISELADNTFLGCNTMKELDISHNAIWKMSADSFRGLSSLRHLRLDNNRLSQLTMGVFDTLPSLQTIHLQNNYLNYINGGIFRSSRDLNVLLLSGNRLNVINADAFLGLSSLLSLHLDNNTIEDVENNAFSQLDNLYYLWLHNNRIKTLGSHSFPKILQLHLDYDTFVENSRGMMQFSAELNEALYFHFGQIANVETVLSPYGSLSNCSAKYISDMAKKLRSVEFALLEPNTWNGTGFFEGTNCTQNMNAKERRSSTEVLKEETEVTSLSPRRYSKPQRTLSREDMADNVTDVNNPINSTDGILNSNGLPFICVIILIVAVTSFLSGYFVRAYTSLRTEENVHRQMNFQSERGFLQYQYAYSTPRENASYNEYDYPVFNDSVSGSTYNRNHQENQADLYTLDRACDS